MKMKSTPRRTLYFAYGANTNIDAMAVRCPAAEPVCRMRLDDARLVMRGVADIEPCRGAFVEGALWWITPACERALDRFEGYPNLYVKQYTTVELDGAEHDVMMYVMAGAAGRQAPPYAVYEATLREGYADFEIREQQLDEAIAAAREAADRPVFSSWATL